jgi:predicted nucleic acid-binding protein
VSLPVWLLDSNVLMGYLNQDPTPGLCDRVEQALLAGCAVSVITWIEILGWRQHTAASREAAEQLLHCLHRLDLSDAVVQQTIDLRSRLAIKLPDAAIAATAMVHGLPLMTRNLQDFRRIGGLALLDPFGP